MARSRRFMRLPPDWEDLGEEDLDRLCDRADRVQGILPELPPLDHKADGGSQRAAGGDDEAEDMPFERNRRPSGIDRETKLDLQDERGD